MKWIFAVTLFLGYFSIYSASWVKLFQGDDLYVHGYLSSFVVDCDIQTKSSVCVDKYILPKEILQKGTYLGTGILISASKYFCEGDSNKFVAFDDPEKPGRIFDLVNTYQTVNLQTLNCPGRLVIETYSYPNHKRTGFQGGALVSGTYEAVDRVKRLNEFVTRDMYRLFFVLLAVFYGIYSIMKKYDLISFDENIFLPYMPYWLIYLGAASDVFEVILPYTGIQNLMQYMVTFFSFAAHGLPVVALSFHIGNKSFRGRTKRIVEILFVLISFLLVVFQARDAYFAIFFVFAFFYVLLGAKESKSPLIAFGIILIMTLLKVLDFQGMPSGRTTSIFIGFYLITFMGFKIKGILKENFHLALSGKLLNYELKTEKALSQLDKNLALFRQAESVAHDIRAPLAVIETMVQSDSSQQANKIIYEAVQRLGRIANDLLRTRRNHESASLVELIQKVSLAKEIINNIEVSVNADRVESKKVRPEYQSSIERMYANLLQNSVEAAPGQVVFVSVYVENAFVVISFQNHAKGVSDKVLEQLNRGIPFSARKEGYGIGSVKSREFVYSVGGEVKYFKNQKGVFTKVSLPLECFAEKKVIQNA